jgi:hypothetical protein
LSFQCLRPFGPQTKIKISISILKINKLYNYSFQITACKVCINEAKNEVAFVKTIKLAVMCTAEGELTYCSEN